ncbi:MAG: hypothetical protein ACRDXX_16795 [Stackebrandtia sp.]
MYDYGPGRPPPGELAPDVFDYIPPYAPSGSPLGVDPGSAPPASPSGPKKSPAVPILAVASALLLVPAGVFVFLFV